ncbi:ATP-binding cassette sub-family C member 4-like, partial [Centruroides vittatus]|uniref:ATP-binding cassette sub-family C member 4-like n=1 Tax=Centruroides vittatus TaxID=120091 RepID=UPI0035100493
MERGRKSNPFDTVGVFSRIFFCWIFPLINEGRKRVLKEEDLYEISKYHTSEYLGDLLQKEWNRELQKENSSILKALLRFVGWKYLIIMLLSLIQITMLIAGQAYFAGLIINYFENRQESNQYNFYATVAGFFSLMAIYMFTFNINVFITELHAMKLKIAFCTLTYRKAIRLCLSSLERSNVGQMVNLLANDISKLLNNVSCLPFLVLLPFIISTSIAMLWKYYGWTILIGFLVIFLYLPIQIAFGKLYSKLRLQAVVLGDERLNLLNEMIADMRLIKMYTWESPYAALIEKIRMKEMKKIRLFLYTSGTLIILAYPVTKLFTFFTYLAFLLNGGQLNAEIVFVTMMFSMYIFFYIISIMSHALGSIAEILVSLKRIQNFLLLQEKGNNAVKTVEERKNLTEFEIRMDSVTAAWKKGFEPTLNGISLNMQRGELLIVIGPVGSGKTSLLMSLLGEIPITSGEVSVKGKISYASQEAWVFNATIKENILFGEEYQEDKYTKILHITALEKDISLFPEGDLTIVGERGVIMSGGQKARINLARALYLDADIFLLDDPLSAVDVPVAKHIFEKCIKEYLKDKICILVTHQIQFLISTSKILVLKKFQRPSIQAKTGSSTGSPISGILCELIIRKLEKRVLYDSRKNIIYFKTYVDDVLTLWKNNGMICKFLEGINNNNDGLKLRMEQKSSLVIHFLDINIVFKKGHFSTNVYIKPSHSPPYIPSQSNGPYSYKLAAFRALIRRAFIYCDNVVDRTKEIDRIVQVAESLGYKKGTIAGIVRKYDMGTARSSKHVPSKVTKFTYTKNTKGIMKEIANRKETRMVLKRTPNLYTILRNDKDHIKKEEKAGVYKIPYENTEVGIEKDYIGVTTRNLGIRLKEHKYDVRKGFNAT